MLLLIYCQFNICCHQSLLWSQLQLIRCLSGWLRRGHVGKPSAVTFLHCSLSHTTMISVSCEQLHCACCTSVDQPISTRYCSPFAHNISLTKTLRQDTLKKLVKYWCILCYYYFTPLLLLVSIALTVTNCFSACLLDSRVGRIDPGTFSVVLTSHCSGYCGFSMLLSCAISNSTSSTQSSSMSFGLSKSPFQLSQSSVS
jgi:hypothetical protein